MLYTAHHITRHLYATSASQCINELRLTPRELANQHLHESYITIEPEAALCWRVDYFGNRVATVSLFEPHDHLVIEANSIVKVSPRLQEPTCDMSWEQAREYIETHPTAETIAALEYRFNSPFVARSGELADYARPTFSPGRLLLDALRELNTRIHDEFSYKPCSTSIDMPLVQVLHNRQGVCQDFSHVMIGALRSLRLPARYVSGYLRSSANFQGAEASHAWVSVFVPNAGWIDFDPTNNVMADERHVTLAWGRDYGDAMPVKGITIGGGAQRIEVEVRVEPTPQTQA